MQVWHSKINFFSWNGQINTKEGQNWETFNGKYWGSLKITSNKNNVYLGVQLHQVSMKLESKRSSFISLLVNTKLSLTLIKLNVKK